LTTSTPDGQDWRPTIRSIVETYEPFFRLMVSYAIPHTSSDVRHVFRPAIDAKLAKNQVPVIKGLIKIKSPAENWDQPIGENDPLEVELPLVIAKALFALEAPIKDISNIKLSSNGDKVVITVRGVMGLSLLQWKFPLFLREKFPGFCIPFGGDTEVFVRPEKFGFNA